MSSKPGPVEYALVIRLLVEPVLIPGPMGMAPMVLVVIWEPVGMALVVVIRACGDGCRGVGDGGSTSRGDDRGGGDV